MWLQAEKMSCLSAIVAHLKCVEGTHHAVKHCSASAEVGVWHAHQSCKGLSGAVWLQAKKISCLSALVAHLKCVEGNHHAIKHLDCEMERKVECCAKAAGVEAVICCRCVPLQ